MKKIPGLCLILSILFVAINLPVSAIIPGEDTAPSASSFTYGELQAMYLDFLSTQQIPIVVGTPEYYQYAQEQIYGATIPALKNHPFYSQIRSYLIQYSALYQDYLYGISALQQSGTAGEQLISHLLSTNSCLQYNPISKQLSFSLSATFLNKTLSQSNSENSALLAIANQSTATTSSNYNYSPSSAVRYAWKYAESHNPEYPYYGSSWDGGDCTNFVSQCLYAGGIPMIGSEMDTGTYPSTVQWYCVNVKQPAKLFALTTSWCRAPDFYTHMTSRSIRYFAYTVDDVFEKCRPGDIVQLVDKNNSYVYHSTIITAKNSMSAFFCAHSNVRFNANIRNHFDDSVDYFIILSFQAPPSPSGVDLDTCEPCDDQVPNTTSVEFADASLDRVVECPHHNGAHDAEKYIYTYNIVCRKHGTIVGTKYETVYICAPEE